MLIKEVNLRKTIFVKADKRDLMRTVKQNMDHIDPTRFRITKEVIGLNRLLFIH